MLRLLRFRWWQQPRTEPGLRRRGGDPVTLFNGDGGEYAGSLELLGKHAAVRLSERADPQRESNLRITLAQGPA